MKLLSCTIFAVLFYVSSTGADESGKRRLQLRVIKHQPCNGKPSASERIRFPAIEQAPIRADAEKGDGCYLITGQIDVLQSIRGEVQIYSETKYGTNTPAERCRGNDQNNCGGVGSCIYCDACAGLKNITKKTSGLVQLEMGSGRRLDCTKGLNSGKYNDVRISFCMPTKEEFLKSQNMDEQFYNQFVADGRIFFITLFMYNERINELPLNELEEIAKVDNDKVIGCHRMVGTVFEG